MNIEELIFENEHLKKRNTELHRRLQQKESPWQAEVNSLRFRSEYSEKRSQFDFRRVCNAHAEMKEVFKMIAPLYGIKCDIFHSVMDSKFSNSSAKGIWANVYLTKKGGIESHNVLDLVKRLTNDVTNIKGDLNVL